MWLADHPGGTASKDEVMSYFSGLSETMVRDDKALVLSILTALDRNHDGTIDFREFVLGLSVLLRGGRQQKIEFIFHALDADNDNSLSKRELKEALKSQMSVMRSRTAMVELHDPASPDAVVDAIFDNADLDGDGVLNLEEFSALVDSSPSLRRHFTISDAVFTFNTPDTSAKKRIAELRVIAEHLEFLSASSPDLEPAVVVRVLTSIPGLSPVAIGEFLGSKDTDGFVKECSHKFLGCLDLKGTTLDHALRLMSQSLCLPRESQQIDRIVEAFAKAYCEVNPGLFPDEDAAYLIAFAIVMLNADVHTAQNKKKMTKQQFVLNTRLAVPGVEEAVFEDIYDRVQQQEITLGARRSSGGRSSELDINASLGEIGRAEVSRMLGGLASAADSLPEQIAAGQS
jgi:Ca2+-binding EF-hand superfamily protein